MGAKGDEIRSYILSVARSQPRRIAALATVKFQITRQAANRHISKLVEQKLLIPQGITRGRSYELAILNRKEVTVPLSRSLQEDQLWDHEMMPVLEDVPRHVSEICMYGFTEMVNNVVDHSEGTNLTVAVEKTAADVTFWIGDDGVGIFNKIASALNLPDPRQSLLELSKGKFTTDPRRHTGEGIFFTSRVFDHFAILSGNLSFTHDAEGDWLMGPLENQRRGTAVVLRLGLHSDRTLEGVFARFSSGPDEYGFVRTHVPIRLAQLGESGLISRSQAKWVLARVDRFEEVLLDFAGVKSIGQSFADEIFRVFARQNPQIRVLAVNTSKAVEQMIARARSHE
jgi:anti-sigma regulatory factor (Ser/Thr protein kinase)